MARPPEITDEEIIAAGLKLEAAGHPVNPFRLHRGVGGRGRADRPMAVWTAYKAALNASAEHARELSPLPTAVRDDLAALTASIAERLESTVRVVAARLAEDAEACVAAERQALSREREVLAVTEADAVETVSSLVDQLEALREQHADVTDQLQRARVAHEAADLLRHAGQERLVAVEANLAEALAEVARVGERAAIAERRIAEIAAELAALRRKEADMAAELAVLRARQTEAGMLTVAEGRASETAPLPAPHCTPLRSRRRASKDGRERREDLPAAPA